LQILFVLGLFLMSVWYACLFRMQHLVFLFFFPDISAEISCKWWSLQERNTWVIFIVYLVTWVRCVAIMLFFSLNSVFALFTAQHIEKHGLICCWNVFVHALHPHVVLVSGYTRTLPKFERNYVWVGAWDKVGVV